MPSKSESSNEMLISLLSGEIGAGLSRAILQLKIQKKIKATATHPELIGKIFKSKE